MTELTVGPQSRTMPSEAEEFFENRQLPLAGRLLGLLGILNVLCALAMLFGQR